MAQQHEAVAVTNGNLVLGIIAGAVAAIVGALIWMGVTVATGMHIGYVAIGIGALVGFAVRFAGKGSTVAFGVVGAGLTLVGCLLGQALALVELAAKDAGTGFVQTLSSVDVGTLMSGTLQSSGPITYFIYAIGIYEGFKLSMIRHR